MTHMARLQWIRRWERQSLPGKYASCLPVGYTVLGGSLGWISWGGSANIFPVLWIMLLPLIWGAAKTRLQAWMLMLGYYLAASRSLPGASTAFFGETSSWWLGWGLWATASLLLSLPFVVLWSKNAIARPCLFVLAVCLTVFPPLGVIGWTSMLCVAGALFPAAGWAGLILTLCAFAVLVRRSGRWTIVLVAVALVSNVLASDSGTKAPPSWRGVDTHFPQLGSNGSADSMQLLGALQRMKWIKDFAAHVPAGSVHILPETVLGPMNGVSEFSLLSIEANLRAKNARILVGAEVATDDGHYLNTVAVLGATSEEKKLAVQAIPVPIGMWKPWASDGAMADVFGFGNVIRVKEMQVGVLVCYEQALVFSFIRTMIKKPNVIVGVSNIWWAKTPDIPNIQHQTVQSFSRLFDVAVIGAKNW